MNFGNMNAFNKAHNYNEVNTYGYATHKGVAGKSILLLGITFITVVLMIGYILQYGSLSLFTYLGANIATIVLTIIMSVSPRKAKFLSVPYAICEGLSIGTLVALVELAFPGYGIGYAGTALVVTIGIFFVCMVLYSIGIVKVGRGFYSFMICISIGLIFLSLVFTIVSIVSMFSGGINMFAYFYNTPLALLLCVLMCIIATLYVITSINHADSIVKYGSDKDMEWYAGFVIALNVIYLFLEVLRLILIIASRNRD